MPEAATDVIAAMQRRGVDQPWLTGGFLDAIVALQRERLGRTVFLIRPIGFVVPTAARRISYGESVEFGRLREEVYREHGFAVADVPPGQWPSGPLWSPARSAA